MRKTIALLVFLIVFPAFSGACNMLLAYDIAVEYYDRNDPESASLPEQPAQVVVHKNLASKQTTDAPVASLGSQEKLNIRRPSGDDDPPPIVARLFGITTFTRFASNVDDNDQDDFPPTGHLLTKEEYAQFKEIIRSRRATPMEVAFASLAAKGVAALLALLLLIIGLWIIHRVLGSVWDEDVEKNAYASAAIIVVVVAVWGLVVYGVVQ
jgi:hypothetical protein